MEKMLAYCGLYCHTCPIYLTSRETDRSKKELMIYDIISMCKKRYGIEYRFNEIMCDGCTSENGRLFTACKDCKIRQCAIDRNIKNCAYCNDYACDVLMEVFATDPIAKENLDDIRSKL